MSISFPTTQYQTPVSYQPQQKGSLRSQIQQDVQTLSADLKSGDLQGAQKSYADLQKILQSAGAISAGSTSPTPAAAKLGGGLNTVLNDFQTLGQALGSGDLAEAQKDFAQLQSDSTQQVNTAQNAAVGRGHGGGHHRHHHVDSDSDQSTTGTTPTTTTGSNQPPATTPPKVQAYQSFSFQATYQSASVSNSNNPSQGQSNAYQISSFQASYQSVGISALNTSEDPTSSVNQSQSSGYQFQFTSFQASYQNVNYLA